MSRTIHILLVEDSPTDVLLAEEALATSRFHIQSSQRLGDALRLLVAKKFDVILLDLGLPDSQGLDTLRTLRDNNSQVAVVVLTGKNDEELALQALKEGAQDYLVKGELESGSLQRAIRYAVERGRSEESRREGEELFRGAFEHTNVAMVLTDIANRFVRVNAAFAQMFGYSEPEMLGMTMADITHADDVPKSYELRKALLAGERRYFQTQKRYRHKDGHVLWGVTNVALVRDANGEPVLYVGQVQDISEQKRLTDERDELLARLQLHIERMPLAYVLFDADLRIREWNPAAERKFGFTREEMLGKGPPYEDFVPRSFWEEGEEIRSRIRSGKMDAHSINENLTKDGRTIICQWFNTPLIEDGGRFVGFLCLARNVTDRIRLEKEVREAQQRLQHVVGSSPAVLFTLAVEGQGLRLTWISENVQTITGYTVDDAMKPTWWEDRLHPDERNRVGSELREMLVHGHLGHDYRFRHRDGKYRWVRAEMRLLRDASGNPLEVVGSWSDITASKSVEEQLRQAQKMEAVGQLAGGIAHDFNNLLTVISGYSEMMLMALPTGDRNRGKVEQIFKAGERAALLTRQLLTFSRKEIVEPKVLDLNAVVDDACKMLRRLIGEDVRLATAPAPTLDRMTADPGQVEQILMNLAINARDAMPQGGRLTVETDNVELDEAYARAHTGVRPGRYVLLAVTDTGFGMTAEVKAKVFEPFFTTKPVGKGTGLGLATVYGIVKQAGGHVAVYSEVGQGTTFKVYFPSSERGSAAGEPTATPRAKLTGRGTILLVEDEDQVRVLTRAALEEIGYDVLEAQDGQAALRLCEAHQGPLDLVMTDVVMPGLSGREVAEGVRRIRPQTKVLYLSGYTDDAVVRHGVLRAEEAFLQKPFTTIALGEKVRDVLGA